MHMLDVQPSLYVFAKKHYAVAAVEGFTPRPYLGEEPTDADRGAAFIPFSGEMGTYANEDDKLTLAPMVTKDPIDMGGCRTEAVRYHLGRDRCLADIERRPTACNVADAAHAGR